MRQKEHEIPWLQKFVLRWAQATKATTMTDSFDKHIVPGQINIADRFDHKPELLSRLSIISTDFESAIWEKLKNENFTDKYELLSTNFRIFRTTEFAKDYDAISHQLRPLKETAGKVLLTWASGMISPIVTDIATFTDNWDDFYYPSSDDLIAISEGWDWIVYLAHYECFFFGQEIISP
jgi:hypothetical protein